MMANKQVFLFTKVAEALIFSLLGWVVFVFSGWLALGHIPYLSDFIHFDSVHYLSIATRGYELFPCTADIGIVGTWCGNTAWQPLYPLLIKIVSFSGLSLELSALLITAMAGFALILMINLMLPQKKKTWRYIALFSAVFFPGATWSHSIFPMSLVLLFGFLTVQGAYQRRSPFLIGIYLSLAILSHSSGFVIAVAVVSILLTTQPHFSLKKYVAFFSPLVVSLGAWLLTLQLMTGNWQAWWLVQQKYYASGQGLLSKIYAPIIHLADVRHVENEALFWPSIQTWLVLVILAFMGFSSWKNRKSLISSARDFFVLFMLGLFPFVLGGQLSVSRNESQIIDARVYVPVTSKTYLLLATALVITFIGISRMFFLDQIA